MLLSPFANYFIDNSSLEYDEVEQLGMILGSPVESYFDLRHALLRCLSKILTVWDLWLFLVVLRWSVMGSFISLLPARHPCSMSEQNFLGF